MRVVQVMAGAALVGLSSGIGLREQVQSELVASATQNDPVCKEINDSWWSTRKKIDKQGVDTANANVCKVFYNDEEACMNKNSATRQKYVDDGKITQDQINTPCTIAGAGDRTCLSNACNQLNNGQCTLALTGGKCIWFTDQEVKQVNKYFKKTGQKDRTLQGNGCYRNPCDMSGLGKSSASDCEARQNGLYQCTYCGKYKKMGCQATQLQTTAQCAPVNNKKIPKESVYQQVSSHRCQCSSDASLCFSTVFPNGGGAAINSAYEPRYNTQTS